MRAARGLASSQSAGQECERSSQRSRNAREARGSGGTRRGERRRRGIRRPESTGGNAPSCNNYKVAMYKPGRYRSGPCAIRTSSSGRSARYQLGDIDVGRCTANRSPIRAASSSAGGGGRVAGPKSAAGSSPPSGDRADPGQRRVPHELHPREAEVHRRDAAAGGRGRRSSTRSPIRVPRLHAAPRAAWTAFRVPNDRSYEPRPFPSVRRPVDSPPAASSAEGSGKRIPWEGAGS